MISRAPQIPGGSGADASWFRWAQDAIMSQMRVGDVAGQSVNRTTRGTYSTPTSSVAPTGSEKRILSWRTQTYYGASLGNLADFSNLDVGGFITGYTTTVRDKVKSELESGKRIRVSMTLMSVLAKTVPGPTVAEARIEISLFCGIQKFTLILDPAISADADSDDRLYSFQGEVSQSAATGSITLTLANTIYGSYQTGASIGTCIPWLGAVIATAPEAAFTAATDGKITIQTATENNIYGSIGLRSITIDSLPKISGG